jgi:hypothetical protein
MANTSVFTGADGSITLSAPQGAQGEAAGAVLNEYELISVGRVQDVRVEVHSDVKAFHEIGQRYATQLRPGNISIRGTIKRAFINGALLKLMLGEAAGSRPAASWTQPSFNITLLLENAAQPGTRSTVTLYEVMVEDWIYGIPEDDFVSENIAFQALYMSTADEAE